MLTVNSTEDTDDGCDGMKCTLRAAIGAAASGDTIVFSNLFDSPQTIELGSALPNLAKDLTITGPGARLLTVHANAAGFSILIIDSGTVAISGMTFSGANAGFGGALNNFGNLTLTDSILTDNHVTDNGGAIQSAGTLHVVGSTFSGNSAAFGAGLFNFSSGGYVGVAELTDTTISGNSAGASGSGIENTNYGVGVPAVTLTNCTVAANTGSTVVQAIDLGGAVTISMKNTIFASGGFPSFATFGANAAITTLGNNLASDDGGGFLDNNLGDLTGVDPGLSALGEFGGPTPTHLPALDSLAIDAGNDTGAPATDQRGVPRPQGSNVDIGAVELRPLVVTTTSDPGDGSCDGTCSLHDAIAAANGDGATADDIFFSSLFNAPKTINLAGALPDVAGDLTLNGPGANRLTVRRDTGGDYSLLTVDGGATLFVSGMTLTNGHNSVAGGAIANYGNLTVRDSALTGNTADLGGGVSSVGRLTLERSTLSANQAADGGALFVQSPAKAVLRNCTISGNAATQFTGGVTVLGVDPLRPASVALDNCALANNVGITEDNLAVFDNGGNSPATARMGNTIFARTALANISVLGPNASATSAGHNLANDGGSGVLNAAGDLLNTDPLLATLSNYGGPTSTLYLKPGSPALEAGDDAAAPATDQRGVARPQGMHSDIGAVESDGILIFQDGFDD